MALKKTLVSPLKCKQIKPDNPKGNQSWIFIGRTDAKVETPVLWSPDVKNWLIGNDSDAGKDWRQEERGTTEAVMVEWHLWLDGHEFEQGLGTGEGQGSLACCSPWGCKESDTTEQLNWTELNTYMWNLENGLDDLIYKTQIETPMQKTKIPQGNGGINWEIGIDIHTLLIRCTKYQ